MGTMVTMPVAPYVAHRSMNSRGSWHRHSRPGDVEDLVATVADELRAERGYALLVLVVQSLSTLFPFTPGGVGTQQGLLVYVFDRAGTGIAGTLLLSFSVGVYVATTILNVLLGFGALFLTLGTIHWRRVVVPDEKKAYARGP